MLIGQLPEVSVGAVLLQPDSCHSCSRLRRVKSSLRYEKNIPCIVYVDEFVVATSIGILVGTRDEYIEDREFRASV